MSARKKAKAKRECARCGAQYLRGVRVLFIGDGMPRGATVCLSCARESVPVIAAKVAFIQPGACIHCGARANVCTACASRPRVVVRRRSIVGATVGAPRSDKGGAS